MPPAFPETLGTQRRGQLMRDEYNLNLPGDEPDIHRHYRACSLQPIPGRGDVELIVLPPSDGITDPAAFAAFIERQWDAITLNLETLLGAAEPVLWESVCRLSDPGVEGWPPDAATLLRSCRLNMVKLNATGMDDPRAASDDGCHELMFAIEHDLGEHDLILGFTPALDPAYAYFDG